MTEQRNVEREAILSSIQQQRMAVRDIPWDYRDDKEIFMAAFNNGQSSLRDASLQLQGDKDVVMAAVSCCGLDLRYARLSMQEDKDIVLAALGENPWAMQYVSPALRNDSEVIRLAMEKDIGTLRYAFPKITGDKEFMVEAVKINPYVGLKYASIELRNDPELISMAINSETPLEDEWWYKVGGYDFLTRINRMGRVMKNRGGVTFANKDDVLEYAREWERKTLERIWLFGHAVRTNDHSHLPTGVVRIISEYFDYSETFKQINELIYLAPVIGADAELERPQLGRLFSP